MAHTNSFSFVREKQQPLTCIRNEEFEILDFLFPKKKKTICKVQTINLSVPNTSFPEYIYIERDSYFVYLALLYSVEAVIIMPSPPNNDILYYIW